MITFPNAKINLGLNVVEKRPDGYHNLQTLFYPVRLEDALEIIPSEKGLGANLHISGMSVQGDSESNLVVKAYHMLQQEFGLPPIDIYLHKHIPIGAGLGGGSADAAFMLKMLNTRFGLQLSDEKLEGYASSLGADCAFFIRNKPVFATGIGNVFEPVELDLSGYHLAIVKPDIFVSTKEAFAKIQPGYPSVHLKEVIKRPLTEWRELMVNDFEKTVFEYHPEIETIKNKLYSMGAVYASMSGSGSAVYGIFCNPQVVKQEDFPECFIF